MDDRASCDSNAYRIDGQPTWLLSGEIHYFKMTRGDWRRRLVQLKCAGFNTVSAYMPWNYHELNEGEWDFGGHRDVEHFLKLAAELGIYVVARPGPYSCNQWQAGGLPAWLSGKPPLSWLQSHNELVLFEETRISPTGVRLSLTSFDPHALPP